MQRTKLSVRILLVFPFSAITTVFLWANGQVGKTDLTFLAPLFATNLILFSLLHIISIKLKGKIKVGKEKTKHMILLLMVGTLISIFFSWLLHMFLNLFGDRDPFSELEPIGLVLMAFFYCLFFLTEIFLNALIRVYHVYHQKLADKELHGPNNQKGPTWPELLVKTKNDLIKLSVANIALIKTMGGVVIIYDMEGKGYLSQYSSLNEIREISDVPFLFRANRQYLVNYKIVTSFEDESNDKLGVGLRDDFKEFAPELKISRYKNKDFRAWYALMVPDEGPA